MPFLPPNQQRQSTEALLSSAQKSKGKGSRPYSITERRIQRHVTKEKFTYWNDVETQNKCADSGTADLELLITVLDDANHTPGSRLSLLTARPAVTLATLKRADTNYAAW